MWRLQAMPLSLLAPRVEFARTPDGRLQIAAQTADNETVEALLDLFRVYFLRRLLA